MPLSKKTISVGMRIRVTSIKANTAGIYRDPDQSNLVRGGITLYAPGLINTVCAVVPIGSVLTVTKTPRKQHGVNFCQVELANGIQGEVFWTELRSNCTEL